MSIQESTVRPEFVSPSWLRCTDGYTFSSVPPVWIREDATLASPNLWERVVCVTLQAQAGDFRNVEALLEVIQRGPSVHIRDCSIRVFSQAAPSSIVARLADVFSHPDREARLEAYSSAVLTCDLRLAEFLAQRRAAAQRFERLCVQGDISHMLEPYVENLEFFESELDDRAFETRVREITQQLRRRYGAVTAIYRGAPVDLSKLVAAIVELCQAEEPSAKGGPIDELFSVVEGMTGTPYAGCLDDECSPVLANISHTINKLRQGGALARLEPGRRYFFGHLIPDEV